MVTGMMVKSVHVIKSCIRYCSPSQLCSSDFLPLHHLFWCFWGVGGFNAEHENGQISNDWAESLLNPSIHLKMSLFWVNYAFIRSKALILYRVRFLFSQVSNSLLPTTSSQDFTDFFRERICLRVIDNIHLRFSGWQKISFGKSPCFSKTLLDYGLTILQD